MVIREQLSYCFLIPENQRQTILQGLAVGSFWEHFWALQCFNAACGHWWGVHTSWHDRVLQAYICQSFRLQTWMFGKCSGRTAGLQAVLAVAVLAACLIAAPPPPPPPAAFTVGTMLPASSLEGLQRQLDQLPNHCPADGPCGGKCCCSAGLGPKHTQQAALLAADGAVLDFVGQDWKQLPASTTH